MKEYILIFIIDLWFLFHNFSLVAHNKFPKSTNKISSWYMGCFTKPLVLSEKTSDETLPCVFNPYKP